MPDTNALTQKKCEPCEGKTQPFTREQAENLRRQTPEWKISDNGKMISREFVVKNFTAAVDFINHIKDIAENENHHPDIYLHSYKKLRVDLSTHAIGGLSENDFIVAAKIDQLAPAK